MQNILKFFSKHKIIIGLIGIGLIIGGYFVFKSLTSTPATAHYVIATVEKGTIITSVSGSGQVSAANQLDLKPKASGDVIYVGVTEGQSVKAGTLLVSLNSQAALKTVRDAQSNLDSANLALEKLQKPADQLSILQAENSLVQAKESKQNAEDALIKAYADGFNTVSNAFLQLPNIITGLEGVLFGSELGGSSQWNIDYYANAVPFDEAKIFEYRDLTLKAIQKARAEYDTNFSTYKSTNRFSNTDVIESLIDQTYNTTKTLAEATKNTNNYIQFYEDALVRHDQKPATAADTQLTTLNTYTGQTNTHLLNLLSIKNTIQSDKNTIINSDRTIAEKTQALADLKAGTDPLDLQSQQLTIKQRQNALYDARQTLADYYIYAPFDGVMATVDVKKGDSASSGTAVAIIITAQKIADISLNEADAAKVKIGQKATLTFDAVDGLSITGEVAQIDTIGTVSQGVVTYAAEISFDTQDERVKPGMSVNAAIITETKQDVLLVPNSAIKTASGLSYVQMLDKQIPSDSLNSHGVTSETAPHQQKVEIGISDDSSTEITSGLKEGDQVITKTISSTTKSTSSSTTTAPSLLGGSNGPMR